MDEDIKEQKRECGHWDQKTEGDKNSMAYKQSLLHLTQLHYLILQLQIGHSNITQHILSDGRNSICNSPKGQSLPCHPLSFHIKPKLFWPSCLWADKTSLFFPDEQLLSPFNLSLIDKKWVTGTHLTPQPLCLSKFNEAAVATLVDQGRPFIFLSARILWSSRSKVLI